jgi:uncharacterized membrane protein
MEKQKKTMFESKFKAIVYSFLMYFLLIAELGILSGLHFAVVDPSGKNGLDIGLEGIRVGIEGSIAAYASNRIPTAIGWNFIIMSILLFAGAIGYCFFLGFKKQIFGGATIVVMNLLPLVGLINTSEPNGLFTFFWGYGTSGVLPLMSLIGLHLPADPNNRTTQAIFMVVFALLCVVGWILGRIYRRSYAEKYEFDLSVPLV